MLKFLGKVYIGRICKKNMGLEKRPLREIINKMVVTKEGKRLGSIKDITFETNTGELIHLILKEPTIYARGLNLESAGNKDVMVPHNSIIAIGDFVVVSEEDFI